MSPHFYINNFNVLTLRVNTNEKSWPQHEVLLNPVQREQANEMLSHLELDDSARRFITYLDSEEKGKIGVGLVNPCLTLSKESIVIQLHGGRRYA